MVHGLLTVLTTIFLKSLRRQCFTWRTILVSASSCVRPIWRTSSLTSVELHLTSLFTEMNTIAPPKSCVNSLLVRNEFKATLFLLCLKKIALEVLWYIGCFCKWKELSTTTSFTCMWLQRIVKITITNYVNTWTSRGQVLDNFNNSICKFVESFGSGDSRLRIYYRWKIQK